MKKSLLLLSILPFVASCAAGGSQYYVDYDGTIVSIVSADESATYSLACVMFASADNDKTLNLTLNDFYAKKGNDNFKAITFVLSYSSTTINGVRNMKILESADTLTLECTPTAYEAVYVAFDQTVTNEYEVSVKGNKLSVNDVNTLGL